MSLNFLETQNENKHVFIFQTYPYFCCPGILKLDKEKVPAYYLNYAFEYHTNEYIALKDYVYNIHYVLYIFNLFCCYLITKSCPTLVVTPWTVAPQAPLLMGFSRQEYWSGLPCLPPGDLPNPEIEPVSPVSPALQADSLPTEQALAQNSFTHIIVSNQYTGMGFFYTYLGYQSLS